MQTMQTNIFPPDLESALPHPISVPTSVPTSVPSSPPLPRHQSPSFMQAAALLTLWSILVVNEGLIRLISIFPSKNLSDSGPPPKYLAFFAALLEIIFGFLGLLLGLLALIFRLHNRKLTSLALLFQTLAGIFVFFIFVFLIPSYRAADLTSSPLPSLSLPLARGLIVLGILTSVHFCLALQGGQFIFMARLLAAATGEDFLSQNSASRMRAIFWNANAALAGLWTVITGIIIATNISFSRLKTPYISPPNAGVLPLATIITGILLILIPVFGIHLAISQCRVNPAYYIISFLLYLVLFVNYSALHFSLMGSQTAAPAAMHAGLVFMLAFLGPFFVSLAEHDRLHRIDSQEE